MNWSWKIALFIILLYPLFFIRCGGETDVRGNTLTVDIGEAETNTSTKNEGDRSPETTKLYVAFCDGNDKFVPATKIANVRFQDEMNKNLPIKAISAGDLMEIDLATLNDSKRFNLSFTCKNQECEGIGISISLRDGAMLAQDNNYYYNTCKKRFYESKIEMKKSLVQLKKADNSKKNRISQLLNPKQNLMLLIPLKKKITIL